MLVVVLWGGPRILCSVCAYLDKRVGPWPRRSARAFVPLQRVPHRSLFRFRERGPREHYLAQEIVIANLYIRFFYRTEDRARTKVRLFLRLT